MIKELQEPFDIWYEEEGKDMLPIKESLEVAWSNGAYVIQDRTCESCKYCLDAQSEEHYLCGMAKCEDMNDYGQYIVTKDFCCNKYEAKDK